MEAPEHFEPPVVAVLSGGNIDPVLLARVLRHGMIAAGRYLSFHLRIPDRPGELARLLAELAASGANVLDVEHLRTGRELHLDEVEVALQLETRGEEHCEGVLDTAARRRLPALRRLAVRRTHQWPIRGAIAPPMGHPWGHSTTNGPSVGGQPV